MHELSITESLLNTACEYAEKNQAIRVTALNLVIGELSGVIDESVQFYWDMISENTICQGATLHFSRIPATMVCLECGNEYKLNEDGLRPCPSCSSFHLKPKTGEEFFLDSIEIVK